jgi:hypothetical protein
MSIELKAQLVMAVRDYECQERQRWDEGTDFTASDAESDEKILLRVLTEPKSKSNIVGVDAVREMAETMKEERYDKGILISERFTESAKKEMTQNNIQMISENYMPPLRPQQLYLAIQDCMEELCKAKCGQVPKTEADCEGRSSDGDYSCKVRLVSDNALFHLEQGWTNLLRKDLMKLLALQKTAKRQG